MLHPFPFESQTIARKTVRAAVACLALMGLQGRSQAQSLQDSIGWGLLRFNSFYTSPAKAPSHPAPNANQIDYFQVSCGAGHTVALRHDTGLPRDQGYVVAWGFNEYGQSTVGLETNSLGEVTPWVAIQVSAGYDHNILLRPNGSVLCWGDNQYGQCDAPADTTNPASGNAVVQVAAGHYFSLALMQDGTLRGWGDNRFGQLNFPRWPAWVAEGQANYDPDHPGSLGNDAFNLQPKRFFRITAGANHVVALLAKDQANGDTGGDPLQNRIVTAWGDNSAGQCNFTQASPMYRRLPQSQWPTNPTEDDKYTRISPYATQIAAGVAHSLILVGPRNTLLDTNHVGANYRSLNIYTSTNGWYRPVRDGMVFGVGSDAYGQAIVPTSRRRPKSPTDPSDAAPEDPRYRFWGPEDSMRFKMIAAGGYHSMAVAQSLGEEKLYCWGLGALGAGNFGDFGQVNDDPTKVLAAADLTNTEPTFLRRRASWSFQPQIGIDVVDPRTTLYSQRIAGGLYHTAAISYQWDIRGDAGDPRAESGVVVAWGRNAEGQCNVPYEPDYGLSRKVGRDVSFKAKQPLPRSRMDSNVRAIWAGGFMPNRDYGYFNDFVVGIDRLGLPVGWGDNSYLQREFFAPWSPVVYSPTLKYASASPGGRFTWLVDSSTRIAHFIGDPLFCFADEFYSPQQGNLAEASAGGFHSLFRTLSGQVFATGGAPFTYFDNYLGFPVSVGWGQGAWDANGVEFEDAAASAYHEHLIPGLLATKVSAGWFHSAAIKQDGTVQCWGAGEARFMNPDDPTIALDQNYTPNFTQSMVPSGVKDCTDVSAGGFHTVALKDVNPATGVGTVVTWGNNGHGQGVLNGIASMAIDEEAVVFRRSNNDVIARGEPAQTDIEAVGPSDFITAGYGSTARLGSDGSLQFFGKLATLSAPIDPATGNPALLRSVAIGESHVLGIRPDGSVIAWGGPTCNNFLQCWSIRDESEWGSRNSVATVAPTRRSHKVPATNYDACITIAGVTSCVTQKSTPPEDPQGLVRFSGDLVSWNGNEANENPFSCCIPTTATLTTDRLLRAVQVAAGRTHSLALRQDGNLQAWGGVERTDDTFTIAKAVSDTPTAGLGVSYIKICAGRDHNIAMQVLGSAQVWGDNTFGQVSPQLPRQPGLLDFDVRDIAAGDRHTVILKSDGRVYAWGDETYSEVDGVIVATRNSNSPAEIPDNTFGVAVAAGGMNTALLRDRLEPRIIGALASLTLPTFSDTMPQAVAVRAGGFHTVVLLPNGAVQAWGAGQDGTADDMQVVGLSTFPNYGQSIPVMRGPDYTSTVKVVLPLSTSNPNPISAGALSTAVLQRRSDMTGPPFAQLTGGEGADGEDGPFPDFDSDGCVTTSDLAILLGEIGNGAWPGADLDGSGEIDMGDVALLQMRLGECLGVPLADAASAN